MSPELTVTLNVIRKNPRISVEGIVNELGWTGLRTAINNRLDELMKLGLLTREKGENGGKAFFYSVASSDKAVRAKALANALANGKPAKIGGRVFGEDYSDCA